MKKFGKILNSRSSGREAVLRARQIINGSQGFDQIILDFSEVEIMSPSFADEFISGIRGAYSGKKIKIEGIKGNIVIKDTLEKLKLL